jgi:uncharacterized sporulation protein YeaH/YhbH (DUF444 family)
MEYFKYHFCGDEWNIYLLDDDDNDTIDEDSAAATRFDDKELYFRKGHYSYLHIKHEVWHVYFSYCYLEHTNEIKIADAEEIAATLFSHRADLMIEQAKEIQDKLDSYKKK